jgi:N-acetylmuramate 1-kinase
MQRKQQIHTWLTGLFPGASIELVPASADASFRRYFRFALGDGSTRIVMDAPPDKEDIGPWLAVQRQLSDAGVHVPAIEAENIKDGFLLISDLGDTTYLHCLNENNAGALYSDALSALVSIQQIARPTGLPDYDVALLQRELSLFPDWFLLKHHQHSMTEDERNDLEKLFVRIIERNLAEPRVFVHRDYHSRNLMVIHSGASANPGVIDFQDAVWGPISYDAVSLLKDAYIQWDEEVTLDWLIRYWEKARKAGVPISSDFSEFFADYEWMGVQRHLKILGIFARLFYRDGKDAYLKELPRVASYIRKVGERYGELRPLLRLLDKLEARTPQVGYTF